MSIAIATALQTSFADAVARTREALAAQGFGVMTEIDMKATLKKKLDTDMENYLILGACNPPLAHRAVTVDRQIGLLLPCNVIVYEDEPGISHVSIVDPLQMLGVVENENLGAVATEAEERLRRVAERLQG